MHCTRSQLIAKAPISCSFLTQAGYVHRKLSGHTCLHRLPRPILGCRRYENEPSRREGAVHNPRGSSAPRPPACTPRAGPTASSGCGRCSPRSPRRRRVVRSVAGAARAAAGPFRRLWPRRGRVERAGPRGFGSERSGRSGYIAAASLVCGGSFFVRSRFAFKAPTLWLPADFCVLTDSQPSPCQPTCSDGAAGMDSSEPGGGGEEEPTLIPFLEQEGNGAAAQSPDLREHGEEDKLEEDLSDGGKMENEVTSEGAGDKSEPSMDSLEHCSDITDSHALKSADRICLFALPRDLKELSDMAKEKQLVVQKIRDELTACQLRIKTLEKQLEYVDIETEEKKEAGNVAAVFRLQAMHRRLCTELEDEKDFELRIALTLKESTLEMWQIETQLGKHEILHKQVKKDEEELEMQYQEQAEVRIRKEKIAALKAEENQLSLKKKEEEAQKKYEKRCKEMVEGAKRNHDKAVYFLRKSMARIHEKNAKEEAKTQEHMERRMQAVLSLKNSITSNREKLQALQARNKEMACEAKKQEMTMREAIRAEGGNVAKEIFLHKRLLEHEKEKQAFIEQQKSRKIEIVSKILQEKASIRKQKNQQSCTKAIKSGGKCKDSSLWRKKAWRYIEKSCKHPAGELPQKPCCSPSPSSPAGERTASAGGHPENIPHDVLCENDEDEKERDKIPAEPELPGLQSQECDLDKISKEETDTKQLATRVMETEILEEKKEEFQTRVFRKGTESGHEHKGQTFYSKPSCIHFKDFDVGKIYKKKIVLINASPSINYCKPVAISEWLKDFISIQFDPPGKMSAGMSCEVGVTFRPVINENLEGEIMFMAQTGSFFVPLKCTVKTCTLALDKVLVDFGTHVVGETISRTINLTNTGALGTRFKVQMSAGDSGTRGAAAASSTARMVTQPCSDSAPEKEDRNSSITSVLEKKEEVCPDHSEEPTCCVAGAEQQRAETSGREQLAQDAFNFHSGIDADNAHNSMEPSPEETPTEIMLGKVTEGEIGPFSSVKLQIVFRPSIPGDVRAEFVITFDNSDCKPLYFGAVGVSIDVPVWVPNPNVDLKICMYDRLYQDCIVIRSRAKTTLPLKFEVCKELSKHMKLLPKTGYIQAQSSFSVQLKFLPRRSLPEDAGSYFNGETSVLEAPVMIQIADNTKQISFTVHAIVTTSDLEISPTEINFGYCTIYEAVWTNVTLTNKSILPQEFGFVRLPEFVEIQPGDGLGVLLPLESLTLDIIFKANKAKEYSFELTCKTEVNRQFKLSCRAVGVHPPLELSHSLVQFAATALNDVSTATLYVMNSHVSANHFTHAVPRIGSGEVAPAGPTSFEFHVPEDCPVTITPSVGTVLPGKKSSIQVSFRPTLSDQLIREEAAQRLCRAAATGAEIQLQKMKKDEKREGKKLSLPISRQPSSRQFVKTGSMKYLSSSYESEQPESKEIKPDLEAYTAAQAFLTRNFRGRFEKYIIPCFVASGDIDEKKGSENLSFSPYNTLYLELHCPAVAPSVVVTSDNGKNTVDFGGVAVGQTIFKRTTIQNISPEKLELRFSVLNLTGPFLLVRAVRMLEPGEIKTLIISFSPNENKSFFETLDIQTVKNNLALRITGHGVTPSTVCSVEEVLDMGYVLASEKATSTFKIENNSTLTLPYSIHLASFSSATDKDFRRIPSFLMSSLQRTETAGTENYNGLNVFSVTPTEGEIVAGNSQDFTVTFSPDHEGQYSECLKVVLFGKKTAHVIQLKGAARDHPMFVEGGIPLDVPIEALAVTSPLPLQKALKEELQEPVKSILLLLEHTEGENSLVPAGTELKVGAIRTAQFASKKGKGFTIEPVKGKVDRGQVKCISVCWVPPADFDASAPLIETAFLTLKGNIKESYRILFVATVVSAPTS
ncbi:cilia- and flagella-associated protein 74 isoform X3 [Numida meleagris]|uniref:cilia- and flagella-associated protein 74 isoform X3 n=1 Tax=Numida meleagris TaxID=8996 RepID=UPI000B3DE7F6|nr:cilia- and flagella-associated protein 74 isoform X3 [Numida meleagris]